MPTALETWAAALVGTRFTARGRTRAEGLDCWGCVRLWHLEGLGVELPSFADGYGSSIKRDRALIAALVAAHRGDFSRLERAAARPGDIVHLRAYGLPVHVGIMLSRREFLHAVEERGVCKGEFASLEWRHRILGFYRHPDVALRSAA